MVLVIYFIVGMVIGLFDYGSFMLFNNGVDLIV